MDRGRQQRRWARLAECSSRGKKTGNSCSTSLPDHVRDNGGEIIGKTDHISTSGVQDLGSECTGWFGPILTLSEPQW